MVLEDCVANRFAEIERRADLEKKRVSYVVDFIKENYDEVLSVFAPVIKDSFKKNIEWLTDRIEERGYDFVKNEFIENRLYFEVREMMDDLQTRAGFRVFNEKKETSEFQLGLVDYYHPVRGSEKLSDRLTKKGMNLISGYSKIVYGN